MLIAYVTMDEVNLAWATQFGEEFGALVIGVFPWNVGSNGTIDATVYDLDHLPTADRRAILDRLLADDAHAPCAVHSYNLEDDLSKALRDVGVAVHLRLERDLFAALWRSSEVDRLVYPRLAPDCLASEDGTATGCGQPA
jgi:hypothetical protein